MVICCLVYYAACMGYRITAKIDDPFIEFQSRSYSKRGGRSSPIESRRGFGRISIAEICPYMRRRGSLGICFAFTASKRSYPCHVDENNLQEILPSGWGVVFLSIRFSTGDFFIFFSSLGIGVNLSAKREYCCGSDVRKRLGWFALDSFVCGSDWGLLVLTYYSRHRRKLFKIFISFVSFAYFATPRTKIMSIMISHTYKL